MNMIFITVYFVHEFVRKEGCRFISNVPNYSSFLDDFKITLFTPPDYGIKFTREFVRKEGFTPDFIIQEFKFYGYCLTIM